MSSHKNFSRIITTKHVLRVDKFVETRKEKVKKKKTLLKKKNLMTSKFIVTHKSDLCVIFFSIFCRKYAMCDVATSYVYLI